VRVVKWERSVTRPQEYVNDKNNGGRSFIAGSKSSLASIGCVQRECLFPSVGEVVKRMENSRLRINSREA
jgi:hypothetical protein